MKIRLVEKHVDEFVDEYAPIHKQTRGERYARWFFFLRTNSNAALQCDFAEWINQFKLFCTYKNRRYRVTGCSTMGDIWLAEDFNRTSGYDLRVDLTECSEWSDS